MKYRLENNRIAYIIILASILFILFHLLIGTRSIKSIKSSNRVKKIKKIMINMDISKKEAEAIYYENHPEELNPE